MSRKFNKGRQSDLLFNEKLHELYTHLEFISYKDGNGELIDMPKQTRQTAIPKGALWLHTQQLGEAGESKEVRHAHKLRVHTDPQAGDIDNRWPCLFEGYYHPATLTTMPVNPVHGQLWIDDNNILRVYNDKGAEGRWDMVCTKIAADEKYDVFNGLDFQSIDPLLPLKIDDYNGDNSFFAVPYEEFGKYFAAEKHGDEFIYCHPGIERDGQPSYQQQTAENVIAASGVSQKYDAKAWIHINPYNINKITKRLIRIPKPRICYQHVENHILMPKFYYEDPNNEGKSYQDCLREHLIEKEDAFGKPIRVVYVDSDNRLVDPRKLYETMPIEMPEDDLDSEMNVDALDPNPIPDDDFDNGMNEDSYQEWPPNDFDDGMNVIPEDPNPIPDDDYDSGMNVEPLDPNPIPDDDFDSGMNEDSYQEIPDDSYDDGMNVIPEDPNQPPEDDFDSDMNVDWVMPELTEIVILEVIETETELADYEMTLAIKERTANENKYNETISFKVGDLIAVLHVKDQNTYFVNVPAGKTEYYAFKSNDKYKFDSYGNKIGRLLKRYSLKEGMIDEIVGDNPEILDFRNDYEIVNGGIILDDNIGEMYDYVYAITYEFKQQHDVDGNLIRITKDSLDGPDQMWIGPCNGSPVVFMDGLYLEQRGDNGRIYKYENESIVFAGNDVLDNMQILVVSFPQINCTKDDNGVETPVEYVINEASLVDRFSVCESFEEGALQVVESPLYENQISYATLIADTPMLKDAVDVSGQYYVKRLGVRDAVVRGHDGHSLFNKDEFPNPLIFYNGLAGYTYVANEVDIDYDTKTIRIYNFGEINDYNGTSSIFAVSLGENNYMGHGVLEDGILYDENVSSDKGYLVIVDGIVMSPYNEDITVEDVEIEDEEGNKKLVGKITITDATIALDSEYSIVELGEPDSLDTIVVVYDDMFTPYTIPIVNPKAQNTRNAYDDCDSAIVMCGPGVLLDRGAVQRDFDATDTFVGGQIVRERMKTASGEELYEWRQYNFSNDYTVLDPMKEAILISDIENIITYYVNDATVMLNPAGIDDQPVTVYAYTYVDSVDEKLLKGNRIIPIDATMSAEIPAQSYTYFYTNRTHLYDTGVNSLSTYINGVMVPQLEEDTTDRKADTFYIEKQYSRMFVPFTNKYEQPVCDNRYAGENIYKVLQVINDNSTLQDVISITDDAGFVTTSLVMKYFNSEHQLEQAKALKRYIENDMKNNTLYYLIENVENNEPVSARRHWKAPKHEESSMDNTYITTMRLTPGIMNVYVNGILLDKDDYASFGNNKIVIGFDLVGGQNGIDKAFKKDYAHPYRVLDEDGKFKYIECESDDEVLIEVRDDHSIKRRSYVIKDISYDAYTFDILDYDYPASLNNSKDLLKIYINGVIYDGNYTNMNGVITLLDCDLEEDPMYKHLKMNPSKMKEYESKYGEYIRHEDIITFEWR